MVETETCTCQHPYELHDAAQREAALREALEETWASSQAWRQTAGIVREALELIVNGCADFNCHSYSEPENVVVDLKHGMVSCAECGYGLALQPLAGGMHMPPEALAAVTPQGQQRRNLMVETETWTPTDDIGDVSAIEVEGEDSFQIAIAMIGVVNRDKEKALRDRIIADHAAAQREAKLREHYDDLHDWAKRWQEGRRKNTEEQKRTPESRQGNLSARIILEARAMNKEIDAILEALAAVTPQQAE